MTDDMLTLEDVAKQLKVAPRTVRVYCTRGDLEFVKLSHKAFRIKPEWVQQMIERKQGRRGR